MASLLARAAVAAAGLPSGRAHRFGSGRLSLAALPGHGVLLGRRDGTGRDGVLAVEFKGAGFLLASKSGRLASVVAAAAASPGESNDGEDAVSAFRLAMEVSMLYQRTMAYVRSPTDKLMEETFSTAKDCRLIVEFLLLKAPCSHASLKAVIVVGQAFLIVEGQVKEGYVKADALANAIEGLKLICKIFFEHAKLPEYSAPLVPPSPDDVDMESFFKELINLFILFYTTLYWEARRNYYFDTPGAK